MIDKEKSENIMPNGTERNGTERNGFSLQEITREQIRDYQEVSTIHVDYPQQSGQEITKSRFKYVLNPMPNGTCRTIKNQYYKNSISNFESQASFGATGVIEWRKCWE